MVHSISMIINRHVAIAALVLSVLPSGVERIERGIYQAEISRKVSRVIIILKSKLDVQFTKRPKITTHEGRALGRPAYYSLSNNLNIPCEMSSYPIIAHELGHAYADLLCERLTGK